MPMPMPMPWPWAGGCCWRPVVAVAPGCPGLAADVWACCWSWVLCPGAPSVWEPGPPWRPDPAGPPAGPWVRPELLPDLEEPGCRRGRIEHFCFYFIKGLRSLFQKCLILLQELENGKRTFQQSHFTTDEIRSCCFYMVSKCSECSPTVGASVLRLTIYKQCQFPIRSPTSGISTSKKVLLLWN